MVALRARIVVECQPEVNYLLGATDTTLAKYYLIQVMDRVQLTDGEERKHFGDQLSKNPYFFDLMNEQARDRILQFAFEMKLAGTKTSKNDYLAPIISGITGVPFTDGSKGSLYQAEYDLLNKDLLSLEDRLRALTDTVGKKDKEGIASLRKQIKEKKISKCISFLPYSI